MSTVVPILLLLVSLLRVSAAVQQALSPHALHCVSGEDCGSNSLFFVGSVRDAEQNFFVLFFLL